MTGTFDDWSKSVKLEKKRGNLHEKMVELPRAEEKIHYKVRSLLSALCSLLFALCSLLSALCYLRFVAMARSAPL